MRFSSLYYSSIGFKECLILIKALFYSAGKNVKILKDLETVVDADYPGSRILPYSTGRAALCAGLRMAGMRAGDEVILSSFTCLAVPTAVIAAGASPVYVDVETLSLNTKVQTIVDAVTPKTKAVIIQHTFGSPADVRQLSEKLKEHNILIIEDCALSAGTQIDKKLAGSFAHAAILSFELSKTISVGWGGMLVINDSTYFPQFSSDYEKTPFQKSGDVNRDVFQTTVSAICHRPALHFLGKYVIYVLFKLGLFRYSTTASEMNLQFENGFVFKLNRPFTALLLHQWKRLHKISQICHSNYYYIREVLTESGFTIPDERSFSNGEILQVASRISVLTNDRQQFIDYFNSRGIEVGLWFDGPLTPVPTIDSFNYKKEKYPNAVFAAEHIVNLPCHTRLTISDLQHLKSVIRDYSVQYPQWSYLKN